jgi:hypothetical protein
MAATSVFRTVDPRIAATIAVPSAAGVLSAVNRLDAGLDVTDIADLPRTFELSCITVAAFMKVQLCSG